MSQSLYTAMGGISSAQTQLNVVSNNIANMNTVAFKQSNVTFQELFNQTISTGNSPTSVTGGKNPMQVGMGVQTGTIAKDYTSGTWTSTGKTTDMMIQGNGFFTVKSSTGEVYLTRAGNFTFDANGDMVNAQGYKILGADKVFGTSSSSTNVHIPQEIVPTTTADSGMSIKQLSGLNNCSLTSGTFSLDTYDTTGVKTGTVTINLDTNTYTTMGAIARTVNDQLKISAAATTEASTYSSTSSLVAPADTSKLQGFLDTIKTDEIKANSEPDATKKAALLTNVTNAKAAAMALGTTPANQTAIQTALGTYTTDLDAVTSGTTCKCDDTTGGTIQFAVDNTSTGSLKFAAGTSNFLGQTQIGSAVIDPTAHTYSSKILNYTVDVEPVQSLDKAQSISSYSIAEDGSIEATYSNGDKLSIQESTSGDNTFQFKYTTSTGVVIRGDDCIVNKNVAIPANFQIQLANVTNVDGLVDKGTNLYMAGPNSGSMIFTSASAMGLGSIKSGGLESSNVDISKQFSDMILAQRAVESNSRVFSTTNDILQTVVRLGQ